MNASELKVNLTADATQLHAELDKAVAKAKELKENLKNNGFIPAFFGFFGGRCTFFAIAFFVVGLYLALVGKLTTEYVALAGTIQGLILAHSAKEDYHERNYNPPTNVNVSVTTEQK